MNKVLGMVLFATIMASLTPVTQAGERISIKGSYGGVEKNQVLQISKTHTLINVINEGTGYVIEGAGAATPAQYAAGPCGGKVEIKEGKASGGGYCIRTNPSGGKFLLDWKVDPDVSKGLKGTGEITGTEGNAKGWKGHVSWGPMVNTSPTTYVNHFEGYLEKP